MELVKPRPPFAPMITMEKKRAALPIAVSSLLCVLLLATSFNMGLLSSVYTVCSIFPAANRTAPATPEPELSSPAPGNDTVPRLAYLVSGSKGDLERLWRTLRALYHPRNQYVVHLDLESPAGERAELASRVGRDPVFAAVGNVQVVAKANMVTYRGPTMVAHTLHACALLLRRSQKWDWFINLSASDYPLVTQDDILHTFSSVPRHLNFVEHTSRLGWKAWQRGKPLIIDPGLYMSNKSDIFWVSQRRQLPTAFKLFTGSAWMALTREFVEYCVWGWDNLPRTLLMYHANLVSSPESYFHTVLCNSPAFSASAVNHDLHYIAWDDPPGQHPRTLSPADLPRMLASGAPFARKFPPGPAPVLDAIDAHLLRRGNATTLFVPGGWCAGTPSCSAVGDAARLAPGPGARRLDGLLTWIVRSASFDLNRCR